MIRLFVLYDTRGQRSILAIVHSWLLTSMPTPTHSYVNKGIECCNPAHHKRKLEIPSRIITTNWLKHRHNLHYVHVPVADYDIIVM